MKRTKGRAPKKPARVPRLVSIPSDVVLSPQSELPREGRGVDRSQARTQVNELTWPMFDRAIGQLARDIHAQFKPDAVVGIAHGGVFVGGALARALECEFFPVRISRRSRDKTVRRKPRSVGDMPPELKNKRVLLVDDVVSSGDTLQLGHALLEKVGAREVKSACLIRREDGYEPHWCGLVTEGLVIFPWDYEPVTEDDRFEV